jgi:hypothetical protein
MQFLRLYVATERSDARKFPHEAQRGRNHALYYRPRREN